MTNAHGTLCRLWRRAGIAALVLSLPVCIACAQEQPASGPGDTKPAAAQAPDAKQVLRPHHVITNDDLPSRTRVGSSPEIEARLQQLNFCDHACFQEAFRESSTALHQHWPYAFTIQENQLIEDALLQRLDRLRADEEWQNRLRNLIAAHIAYCHFSVRYQAMRSRQDATGKSVTPADLAEEEAIDKHIPNTIPNNNAAGGAVLEYLNGFTKDPLRRALMLHQYMAQIHESCTAYTGLAR